MFLFRLNQKKYQQPETDWYRLILKVSNVNSEKRTQEQIYGVNSSVEQTRNLILCGRKRMVG